MEDVAFLQYLADTPFSSSTTLTEKYRAFEKLQKPNTVDFSFENKRSKKTNAQKCRDYRLRKKLGLVIAPKQRTQSNAEKQKKYRLRKKLQNRATNSNADKQKKYRLRKKMHKQDGNKHSRETAECYQSSINPFDSCTVCNRLWFHKDLRSPPASALGVLAKQFQTEDLRSFRTCTDCYRNLQKTHSPHLVLDETLLASGDRPPLIQLAKGSKAPVNNVPIVVNNKGFLDNPTVITSSSPTVSGQRLFSCKICLETFTELHICEKHEKTHTVDKLECQFSHKTMCKIHENKVQSQIKCRNDDCAENLKANCDDNTTVSVKEETREFDDNVYNFYGEKQSPEFSSQTNCDGSKRVLVKEEDETMEFNDDFYDLYVKPVKDEPKF